MKKYFFVLALACVSMSLKAQRNDVGTYLPLGHFDKQVPADSNQIFTKVEKEPVPKDGLAVYYKFITDHIQYPTEEKARGIQGRAILQFIVERDGSVSDIKVLRTPSEALGKEAIRVLASAPKWNPGMQGDQKVRVRYLIPINFSL